MAARDRSSLVLMVIRGALPADADVRTDGLTVAATTDAMTDKVTGYRATQTINVRSTNIAAGLRAYKHLADAANPALTLEPPTCFLEDDTAALASARTAAWADLSRPLAQIRANAGTRVGRMRGYGNGESAVTIANHVWSCEAGFVAKTSVSATFALD